MANNCNTAFSLLVVESASDDYNFQLLFWLKMNVVIVDQERQSVKYDFVDMEQGYECLWLRLKCRVD